MDVTLERTVRGRGRTTCRPLTHHNAAAVAFVTALLFALAAADFSLLVVTDETDQPMGVGWRPISRHRLAVARHLEPGIHSGRAEQRCRH
jgi:hypothetical protein